MGKVFEPHGSLNVYIEGNILYIKARYAPNSEMVAHFQEESKEHIDALSKTPWGSIAILEDDSIFPLDAKEMIEANVSNMTSMGLAAIAVIIRNSESPNVVNQYWQSIYEKQKIHYQFFYDETAAKSWLLNLIALKENQTR